MSGHDAPTFEYRGIGGIGRRRGNCFCGACRHILETQLRELIQRLPPAERVQRVLELCKEVARNDRP